MKIRDPEKIDLRTRKRIVYSFHTRGWDWEALAHEAILRNRIQFLMRP
jgi:hypothetical protein